MWSQSFVLKDPPRLIDDPHSYSDFRSASLLIVIHMVDLLIDSSFSPVHFAACLASSPGQVGRADGYILEGKELEFYLKKIKTKKEK